MGYYEKWQKDKYGTIIKQDGQPEEENGAMAQEDSERWVNDQEQFSLTEQSF